jgi:hypothetical protein
MFSLTPQTGQVRLLLWSSLLVSSLTRSPKDLVSLMKTLDVEAQLLSSQRAYLVPLA